MKDGRDSGRAIEDAAVTIARRHELTARERDVLELLIAGRRNAEIGSALRITVRNVRAHAGAIYEKTGIDGREELPRLLLEIMLDAGER